MQRPIQRQVNRWRIGKEGNSFEDHCFHPKMANRNTMLNMCLRIVYAKSTYNDEGPNGEVCKNCYGGRNGSCTKDFV